MAVLGHGVRWHAGLQGGDWPPGPGHMLRDCILTFSIRCPKLRAQQGSFNAIMCNYIICSAGGSFSRADQGQETSPRLQNRSYKLVEFFNFDIDVSTRYSQYSIQPTIKDSE